MAPSHACWLAGNSAEGRGRYRKDQREALTGGVQAGLWSRENDSPGVPTRFCAREGNTVGRARRERFADPARSENHGMYASFMHENRESPESPVVRSAAGRSEGG
jgi:hypothetical protein